MGNPWRAARFRRRGPIAAAGVAVAAGGSLLVVIAGLPARAPEPLASASSEVSHAPAPQAPPVPHLATAERVARGETLLDGSADSRGVMVCGPRDDPSRRPGDDVAAVGDPFVVRVIAFYDDEDGLARAEAMRGWLESQGWTAVVVRSIRRRCVVEVGAFDRFASADAAARLLRALEPPQASFATAYVIRRAGPAALRPGGPGR